MLSAPTLHVGDRHVRGREEHPRLRTLPEARSAVRLSICVDVIEALAGERRCKLLGGLPLHDAAKMGHPELPTAGSRGWGLGGRSSPPVRTPTVPAPLRPKPMDVPDAADDSGHVRKQDAVTSPAAIRDAKRQGHAVGCINRHDRSRRMLSRQLAAAGVAPARPGATARRRLPQASLSGKCPRLSLRIRGRCAHSCRVLLSRSDPSSLPAPFVGGPLPRR